MDSHFPILKDLPLNNVTGSPACTQNALLEDSPNKGQNSSQDFFEIGAEVIYGLHGKCVVLAIEPRSISNVAYPFYKLAKKRNCQSLGQKPIKTSAETPAIWVPIQTAHKKGLRRPLSELETQKVFEIFQNKEIYFDLSTPWQKLQAQIEKVIFEEGGIGLAKGLSFLHVYVHKQWVPSSELIKFHEMVEKLLLREMADALGCNPKNISEKIAKGLRLKLLA